MGDRRNALHGCNSRLAGALTRCRNPAAHRCWPPPFHQLLGRFYIHTGFLVKLFRTSTKPLVEGFVAKRPAILAFGELAAALQAFQRAFVESRLPPHRLDERCFARFQAPPKNASK